MLHCFHGYWGAHGRERERDRERERERDRGWDRSRERERGKHARDRHGGHRSDSHRRAKAISSLA